jgi:uncharacterized protein YndB with AHSA1/START domain
VSHPDGPNRLTTGPSASASTTMDSVRWPDGHEPDGAAIHVVNTARSVAPPELVWAWLVRPDLWHANYSNAHDVRHIAGPWPQIGPGSRFSWITFRAPVTTEVTEFQPYQRLAWTGTGRHGARGHHAWILMPDATGTVIYTEETQRGLPPLIFRPILRPAMRREHQRWVEGLFSIAANSKDPPA